METSLAEMAQLQQEKQEYEAKRDQLNIELHATEQKIIELQSKWGAIHNAMSAPVLELPNEITCMIFDHALVLSVRMAEDLAMMDAEAKLPPEMEVVISHVCHQWRSIALSYPQLWSHFRYDVMRSPLVPLERFDAYLDRSQSTGLELWFNFKGAYDEIEGVLTLLEKAVPHFARWRRFTLMADAETHVLSVLGPIFKKPVLAPMLEHFAICPSIDIDDQEIKKLEPMVFKKGAPNLRSVMLDLSGAVTFFPPLDNLTTLRLEDPDQYGNARFSWPVFRDLLSLKSLVNLSIMMDDAFHKSEFKSDKGPPIAMNNLKNLRIANFDLLVMLLLFIRAPLLESLTMKELEFPRNFSTSAPGGGKSNNSPHSFPSIKYLSFINIEAETPAARHFAKMTPNATEITFSNGDYSESFFHAVASTAGAKEREKMWPKLRVINFNMEADSLDELLRLAKGRPKKDPITLRLFDDVNEMFRLGDFSSSARYEQLAKAYHIETINSQRNWLRQVRWPPASELGDVGLFADLCDPFNIDDYDE